MSVKQRLKQLEKQTQPQDRRMYVIFDDRDHVIAHPGGYMSKADFEALDLAQNDIVIKVVHVDMEQL